jgi:hypothetical protein
MTTRRYALTKVRSGDYLCLSNDGTRLWRFTLYQDGSDLGLDVDYKLRTFWRVQYSHMSEITEVQSRQGDILDPMYWFDRQVNLPTRQAAINVMLGSDSPTPI